MIRDLGSFCDFDFDKAFKRIKKYSLVVAKKMIRDLEQKWPRPSYNPKLIILKKAFSLF